MKKYLIFRFVVILLGTFTLQCKKNNQKFYIHPGSLDHHLIAMNEFTALVPLGFLSPPAHVFPNDHMAMYYKQDVHPVNIYAPGNLRLVEMRVNTYNPGTANETHDYVLSFGVNGKSMLILAHISQLSDRLNSVFAKASGKICEEYMVGNGTVQACHKDISLDVVSGEIIGYSNLVPGQLALDIGMYIDGKGVAPLDFFSDAIRTDLESRLMGAPNSEMDGVQRTADPLSGEIDQDIPGTLQGIWLQQGFPRFPESNHVAFVKNNIIPTELRISFGSSVPVLGPGLWKFVQKNTGVVDRAYADVKNDGQIYCYDPLYLNGSPYIDNSVIVKLENNSTISLERRDCDCSTNLPYSFSNAKITYVRQ